ncbi:MAG: hypothetical protein IJE40_03440 [Clostridia bacterium]|nr:hypothetical protein [Clostridia bacterium]
MVKFDKNSVVGISSLVIFCIFATMNVHGGVLKYVLFGFLHFILAFVTFVLMSFVVEKHGENCNKSSAYWCDLAPFAIILLLSQVIASWDFYIVFYFIGMIYMTLNEVLRRLDSGLTFKDVSLYMPVAVGVGSVVLYVAFSFAGGSPV